MGGSGDYPAGMNDHPDPRRVAQHTHINQRIPVDHEQIRHRPGGHRTHVGQAQRPGRTARRGCDPLQRAEAAGNQSHQLDRVVAGRSAGVAHGQGDAGRQDDVLNTIRTGDPPGEVWQRMPAYRWWIYVALRQISSVYYAHPYAWDEIGFGGPAYPRGYFALNYGDPEPWEAREVTQ